MSSKFCKDCCIQAGTDGKCPKCGKPGVEQKGAAPVVRFPGHGDREIVGRSAVPLIVSPGRGRIPVTQLIAPGGTCPKCGDQVDGAICDRCNIPVK